MHALVTIVVPFDSSRCGDVDAQLDKFGNPAARFLADRLDELGIVHFLSVTVVRSGDGSPARLVTELSADGAEASAVRSVCGAIGDPLLAVLKTAGIDVSASALPEFLLARRVPVGQGWFGTPGLVYDGAPGMTVDRIRRQAELAETATDLLKEPTTASSALAGLEEIRTVLWSEGRWKWAFVAEPTPMVSAGPAIASRAGTTPTQVLSVLSVLPKILPSLTANFLWPFLILLLALVFSSWWRFGLAAGGFALVLGLIAEVIAGLGVYGRLRRLEKTERPDDIPPNPVVVAEIMKRENFGAQNHMAAVSTMKPGPLRRATLRFGLWAAGQIALRFSRPGFLGPTGEIHFARWLLLPGTDKLLFFSNYDGGWESYLEDFIERSSQGVSGIWSNTIGFPKTTALFFDGASDGDRLRRWTRRQQHPTRFWYSAYPSLTQDRIRLNAAIRQGLANAKSEADAEDWLSCFGSLPRALDSLEIDQIPTLVFGGLRRLAYARCLLVELAAQQAGNKSWLRTIEPRISYGNSYVKGGRALEESDAKFALVVGFTRSGLERLGTKRALETFPAAFVHGSGAGWRARPLGDVGANAPETWLWGGPASKIDAIVLMYGRDLPELERLDADQRDALRRHGLVIRREVTLEPVPQTDPVREPFGFVDGISDPIIRGVGGWTRPELRNHLVAPGEIVLGYPDGSGMLPCTPTISASEDPDNVLPAAVPFDPDLQRPDFANPKPVGAHDLGFNGTYMVVRQLEQDVEAFHRYCGQFGRDSELMAAKMIGRWKYGASLVRYPLHASEKAAPDNDFLFGVEDADGRRCPLGAHIRRANPRDNFDAGSQTQLSITNRHRILRVGRSYLPQNGREKPGLLFMCLNSDIERQFEFLQQTWLLGASFSGLENEIDPVLCHGEAHMMTIPTETGPRRLPALPNFVQILGSGYFFLPGRKAVHFLAH